jgi:type IV pilus assembly protein PilC
MVTATAQRRDVKEFTFVWEGSDRNNRQVRGRDAGGLRDGRNDQSAPAKGIRVTKVKKQSFRGGAQGRPKGRDVLHPAARDMLRAGVPLLAGVRHRRRGHGKARFSRLMMDIKGRIEAGSSLSQAFREHPKQFDALYCNLVSAGETSGTLDAILDRLATYKEKILAIKGKIKAALFYPISVITVAIIVVWVIMVWVIPAFKQVFSSFGADLPAPTLIVMAISDFFVSYWWLMAGWYGHHHRLLRHVATIDSLPLHGRSRQPQDPGHRHILEKATVARWTRTPVHDVRRGRAARRVARRRRGRRRQFGATPRAPSGSRRKSARARA